MRNAGLHELKAGIKMGGETSTVSCVNDTTLIAESKEELKNLLIRVKESERDHLTKY